LANVVFEFSTWMDVAIIASYKEIIRVIKFVLDTRDTFLKLKPNLDDENRNLGSIVKVIGSMMLRIVSV
jgi:hypothetical protein